MLDERFSIRGNHLQIRDLRLSENIRAEMTAQAGRPDVSDPVEILVLAGLAVGALPAIADHGAEHAAEEGHLITQQAFDDMERSHEFETRAKAEQPGIQFHQAAKRTVRSPRRFRAVMIPYQELGLRPDRADRRTRMDAAQDARCPAEHLAQQAGVDGRAIDQEYF